MNAFLVRPAESHVPREKCSHASSIEGHGKTTSTARFRPGAGVYAWLLLAVAGLALGAVCGLLCGAALKRSVRAPYPTGADEAE